MAIYFNGMTNQKQEKRAMSSINRQILGFFGSFNFLQCFPKTYRKNIEMRQNIKRLRTTTKIAINKATHQAVIWFKVKQS